MRKIWAVVRCQVFGHGKLIGLGGPYACGFSVCVRCGDFIEDEP